MAALLSQGTAETIVQGEPFGYVKMSIPAGSSGTKRTTQVSIPLLDMVPIAGKAQGTVTSVGPASITDSTAGWTAGGLSALTNRFVIQITSGVSAGRMFLIGTNPNTANTVTIDPMDTNAHGAINTLGIQPGDGYRIHPCDTVGTFFQTPNSSGVVGGTTPSTADTILVMSNTTVLTLFYHTLSNRWVAQRPNFPDFTHWPLPPYTGLQYARIGTNALNITVTGRVPNTSRLMPIRNSGTTYVSQYWPVATVISNLGFDKMTGWARGTNLRSADRLIIATSPGATPKTYFFHSLSNTWVENNPRLTPSGAVSVPVGANITVQRASNNPSSSLLRQAVPYTLQ